MSELRDIRRPVRALNTEAEESTALRAVTNQRLIKTQQIQKT
jgi:hypothetical protein